MSAAAPVHGNTRTRGRRGHREMTPSSIMLLLALTACLARTVFCQGDEDTSTVEETQTENYAWFSEEISTTGYHLKSSEAPLEDSLSLTFVLVPVVLVVVIIAMVVGVVIINRRWNWKGKSNSDNVEEDKYLHGSDDTEKVPMPMFEDDVPSVLELEMEDLEQWMNKDGGVRMDSGQGI
ncbi:transmembrane protein 154 isoform X5 [Oncorhynchus tshawytscha]|uniref:transmembrane protein 154 isoform X5 n=1 Tax=Oncorhynchus tshawytscha TaxID=74940 RepID=UPI000D099C73|nr:transmembrane protein 154 isoform X5 [Oncorhynchus tshawytscha]